MIIDDGKIKTNDETREEYNRDTGRDDKYIDYEYLIEDLEEFYNNYLN